MFSLDDKSSFEFSKTLIYSNKSNLLNNKDLNIILLGNKYDLKGKIIKKILKLQKKK